jgi:quercetin dioxygenase-like cupin family protein
MNMSTTQEEKVFIENREVPWEPVTEGVKRKIMAFDEKLMLVKVEFEKGAVGALHRHHHSQITHVESGIFEVQINGEKKLLTPGDAYYIPSNVLHGCECMEPGVLIDVFSPMREDFVK